jgi:hypothetical protein
LTSEIHLTLTEWKPIPYIFPIRTTVRIGRGKEDPLELRKLGKKIRKNSFFFKEHGVKKGGTGDCCNDGQYMAPNGYV